MSKYSSSPENMDNNVHNPEGPTFLQSIIPVLFLITLLSLSVFLYGEDSSYGANQIALMLSGGVAALVGWRAGHKWRDIEAAIAKGIANTVGAMLILFMVGSLIGTWILSGTVPSMIYYGLQIINPNIFYFTACALCAVAALSIGSSWSTAGTIGIGLMGISAGLGLSPEITAGAIISGAYFGDKMSPLSDTTNLAPAVAGTDLFTHIQHMIWTTGPAILIALTLYALIGIFGDVNTQEIDLGARLLLLEQNFSLGIHLLLPMVVVFYMAMKKYPAFPTLMIGSLIGGLFAILFQQEALLKFAGAKTSIEALNMIDGVWTAMFGGFSANTGNEEIDELLTRGGMANMVNTIWLIMSAIIFGSIMEKLGFLKRLVQGLLGMAHSTGSLILVTALTCIGVNIIAADQYIAIVLPGRMYRIEFKRRKLASKNLSRTLEDTATVTSVLIPWNTCGAFMAGTLGVATFAYVPYCFFNLLSPLFSIAYGFYNIKIAPMEEEEAAAV